MFDTERHAILVLWRRAVRNYPEPTVAHDHAECVRLLGSNRHSLDICGICEQIATHAFPGEAGETYGPRCAKCYENGVAA
jgi:hypothetical protein